tara:strand:- start:1083 stop:2171 length:1089 start_codon:yes stop_codon:yes gene_type:complete
MPCVQRAALMGIEDLLLIQVLILPLIWFGPTIGRRFDIEAERLERFLLLVPVALLGAAIFLAVSGHRGSPSHTHATLWGVSDSILTAVQYLAGGPEGGILICAFVGSVWILICRERRGSGPWIFTTAHLLPLIAVGTSSGAFTPVSSSIASSFVPEPSFIPLMMNSALGFLIAELLIRTSSSMNYRRVRKYDAYLGFAIALTITLFSLRPDSVLELEPVIQAYHLVVVLVMFSVSDMLGGSTEASQYSSGMTWPSFAITLLTLVGPGVAVFVGGAPNLSVLWAIGTVSVLGALGSQLPRLGMDLRNRSAHRGAMFGGFVGIALLVITSEPSLILLLGCLPLFSASLFWNPIDRHFGLKSSSS